MALERITNPPVLDSTGLTIVQKLEAIKNAVQPVNAGTDIDITIPSSGWSSESPYQYTYSNAHITSGALVKVTFLEGSGTSTPLYLEFEKVTNGVRFEAPSKPTNDISVRIHIFSADTTSTAATSADEVSTSAVSGASNVDDALGVLDTRATTLENLDHREQLSAAVLTDSWLFSAKEGEYKVAGSRTGSFIEDADSNYGVLTVKKAPKTGDLYGFIIYHSTSGTTYYRDFFQGSSSIEWRTSLQRIATYDQIGNITELHIDTYGTGNYVYRIGRLCFISCVTGAWYSDSASAGIRKGSATGTVWKLNSDYIPVAIVEIKEANMGKRITIGSDGVVACSEQLSGVNLRFSGCWISA